MLLWDYIEMTLSRRTALTAMAAFAALPALGMEPGKVGLDYLEQLDGKVSGAYLAPSRIDPAYSHALYINAATSGAGAQKMWVLERAGADWRLALWDETHWGERTPEYSWPISTGRHYPGDRRSGPTPLGIFNVDDRTFRHVRGWGAPGMYNSIFIDLHYSSGRISGVAMHGTTRSKYRLLGRPDSHGCIRMTQPNADRVWAMFHGPDGRPGDTSPLWSEAVPRYFTSAPRQDWSVRRNYTRDGSFHTDESGERLTKPGYAALFVIFRDDV